MELIGIRINLKTNQKTNANETPPNHNNRSRASGGVWGVAAVDFRRNKKYENGK